MQTCFIFLDHSPVINLCTPIDHHWPFLTVSLVWFNYGRNCTSTCPLCNESIKRAAGNEKLDLFVWQSWAPIDLLRRQFYPYLFTFVCSGLFRWLLIYSKLKSSYLWRYLIFISRQIFIIMILQMSIVLFLYWT